ncbi:MAG: hypothetical protein Q8Q89_02585 [bacterium]|nr:hypothetical protein [bacterium]
MKALLLEDKSLCLNKRSAILLLPSRKLEPAVCDPANIIMELDGENLRVWVLSASEFASFRIVKEVDISSQLFLRALQYRNTRIVYEREKVEFKNCLMNEMVDSNCDALSFLDLGSKAL